MKTKICSQCKQEKLLKEFSIDRSHRDGKRSECTQCRVIATRKFRKEYPWKVVFHSIKTRCNNPNSDHYQYYHIKKIKCKITEEEIKFLWFRDKAYNLKQPSIDRKNNDGNYCLKNCRFIEMKINSIKDREKQVNQYNLQGNFIKTWKSQAEVQRVLGFHNSGISMVCTGKRKTAGGFVWKYSNELEDEK